MARQTRRLGGVRLIEPTLFKYIMRFSWRDQVALLLVTLVSFPFLYASLELPKMIVNKAIGGESFPQVVLGYQLDQIPYLFTLCGIFLGLVGINGAFKFYLNVYKGLVGERMLRRLRYTLFADVLRFPLPQFRRTSQGELIAMITSEVETLGGFIGDAVALPAFQGGTLLTIVIFMFVQDWVLGLAAIALYPLQIVVIPRLQRQVNLLAKERVRTVRRLSERIGEGVAAIDEVHGHDTSEWHRADFSAWVATIFEIRFKIYKKKFFIKFLNNFLAQLTPFFFYSIGGYLVIKDQLTFGALVAVLAAYKDMSSPWKELLDWYQMKEDARIKYDQLYEQFRPAGMLPPELQRLPEGDIPHLGSPVLGTAVVFEDESGVRVVEGASFQFEIDRRVALVGGGGAGTDALARLLARLLEPTAGAIHIGNENLNNLPEYITGRRIAYVGPHEPMINASVRDNLYYSLRHQPLVEASYADGALRRRQRFVAEAEKTGNTASDLHADWLDYAAAGVDDASGLRARAIELVGMVDLEPDLFLLGLKSGFDPAKHPELAERLLEARRVLHQRLSEAKYRGLVEPFDRERYNSNMSVGENTLFGLPVGQSFDLERLGENTYIGKVLDSVGMTDELVEDGLKVAKIMVDLFRDLPPGHEFFDRYSFISAEDLPEYATLIRRVEAVGLERAAVADRRLLISLAMKQVSARHRLGLLTPEVEARLLTARQAFADNLSPELRLAVAFFDPAAYNPAASLQDNVLFGKIAYGRPQAGRQVGALIDQVLDDLDLRAAVVDIGLDVHAGIGGGRLSQAQRQKLALARALIRRPDLLIIDRALVALDPGTGQEIRGRLLTLPDRMGLVWVTDTTDDVAAFDRVIVMDRGRVIEQRDNRSPDAGRPASELQAAELQAAEQPATQLATGSG